MEVEQSVLTNEEIVRFYNELLYPLVTIRKLYEDPRHLYAHHPFSFMKLEQTSRIVNCYGVHVECVEGYCTDEAVGDNQVVVSCNYPNGDAKKHCFYAFLNHLRNSFAHCYIQREDRFLLFKDFADNGKLTLNAKIDATIFFEFIAAIYKEYGDYKNRKK